MKRRDFLKGAAIAGALSVAPAITFGNDDFVHDSKDYADVPDEGYEFEEYEISIPEDWAEEDIDFN